LLYNGHGSVRQLSNSSGGIVTDQVYSYDAYGVSLGYTGTKNTNLQYTGEQFDDNLGQYYLRARYYNPSNGRFNRVDPFSGNNQDPQSLHKYLYCHANPVNGVDPTGQRPYIEILQVAAIVGFLCGLIAAVVTKVKKGTVNDAIRSFNVWFTIGFFITIAAYVAVNITYAMLAAVYGASAGLGDLQYAGQYGIQSYNNLSAALRSTGLNAHHIIPQRFAQLLGLSPGDMPSVAVDYAEHLWFTNIWRYYVPYGVGTKNATKEVIWQAAQEIYAEYPALLDSSKALLSK